ncbi:MAG: hypothetical protein ACK53Y_17970, partial [bacterium]
MHEREAVRYRIDSPCLDNLREAVLGIRRDKLVPNPHPFDKLESIGCECRDIVCSQLGQKWRLRMS